MPTRGFYALGSGMLTSKRAINAISNNIANVKTPGYKKTIITSSTFGDMVLNRIDSNRTSLGDDLMIRTATQSHTVHSEGFLKSTERSLDFAIKNSGFFGVQTANGLLYTRNGSFNLDEQGYLYLNGEGRVMGENGPIQLNTDKFYCDNSGNLYVPNEITGEEQFVDKLAIYDMDDYENLVVIENGMYTGNMQRQNQRGNIDWQTIEGSNVDTAEEMTEVLSNQRMLQTCSKSLQIYDQIMAKSVAEIGKV